MNVSWSLKSTVNMCSVLISEASNSNGIAIHNWFSKTANKTPANSDQSHLMLIDNNKNEFKRRENFIPFFFLIIQSRRKLPQFLFNYFHTKNFNRMITKIEPIFMPLKTFAPKWPVYLCRQISSWSVYNCWLINHSA